MLLCPLLQTLGLETEARDNFLTFNENTIFIAVSADASSVDGATTGNSTQIVIFTTGSGNCNSLLYEFKF